MRRLRLTCAVAVTGVLWSVPVMAQDAFKLYWNATNNQDPKTNPGKPDFANMVKLPAEFRTDIVILYEHQFGIFDEKGPGGMLYPKKFKQHLDKAAKDLEFKVPDPDFDGIIVLDYEKWCPGYASGDNPINKEWKADYLKFNPGAVNAPNLEEILKTEYDALTKKYFVETIKLGKKMRPKSKWGIYSWPFNYMGPAYLKPDPNPQKIRNDEFYGWAWELLDVITPEVYVNKHVVPDGSTNYDQNLYWTESTHRDYVISTVREAKRVAKGKPVLPYFCSVETSKSYFGDFTKFEDAERTIKILVDEGATGMILWDHFHDYKKLNGVQKWANETLCPVLFKLGLCKDPNKQGGGEGGNGNGGGGGDDKKKPGMATHWKKKAVVADNGMKEHKKRWLWVRKKGEE